MDFLARKTAVYDSIYLTQPVPDPVKKMTTDTYMLEDKIDRDDLFWEKNRKSELTAQKMSKVYDHGGFCKKSTHV